MRAARAVALILFVLSVCGAGAVRAQCSGTLALSSTLLDVNYLVRLAVHFGDAASIPSDIVCSRSLLPGESVIDVPLWAYNLHEGAIYLEFSVASNESISVFTPDNSWNVVGISRYVSGSEYRLDLALQAMQSVSGPVRIGYAQIVRVHGSDPVWIDLRPNSQTGKMIEMDNRGNLHDIFSPQHGGFLGQSYLYTCQEPICEEPNAPVSGFTAEKGLGCAVELSWVAGSGNRTMVRYRTDRYPRGTEDGVLAIEIPSIPGEIQCCLQIGVSAAPILYYTAFSLTRDAGELITRGSFVECASVDTAAVTCEIGVESTSWGAIKSLFK
jgi:hypothetical protein